MTYIVLRICEIILAVIVSIFVTWLSCSENRLVDTDSSGEYTVELVANGDPEFPFGPQYGRLVLKDEEGVICSSDFVLHNDGKQMSEDNWSVEWEPGSVEVTISGEEQEDETIVIFCDREYYGG